MAIVFAALGAAALVASCGGGGDGGTTQTPATLTAANSGAATSTVAQALALLDSTASFTDLAPVSASARAPMNVIVDRMRAMSGTLQAGPRAQGSMHDSGPCSDSGTITMDANWTDDPNAYMGMRDLHMTITASNCVEYPYTMNGTLSLTFSGTLDMPTGFTFSAPNSRFADASSPFDITMSGFSMALTNITSSGGAATFNGAVRGNVDMESIDGGFQNFRIVYSEVVGANFSYDLSGRMRASCLGGWITVDTPTPVSGLSAEDCPTAGEINITSGGDTVHAVIGEDFTIDVFFNDVLAHTYTNCNELTGLCSAL